MHSEPQSKPIVVFAIPLLTFKGTVAITSGSLTIPVILQPSINRREVKINEIFRTKRNLSLYDEYLRENVSDNDPATAFINNKMVAVIFSIALKSELQSNQDNVELLSVFQNVECESLHVAVAPCVNDKLRSIMKKDDGQTMEDDTMIETFVRNVLTTDITDPDTLAGFVRTHLSERVDPTVSSSYENNLKIAREHLAVDYNLFIGFAEGGHRSAGIHFIMENLLTMNVQDLSYKNCPRLLSGPLLQLHMLVPTELFLKDMRLISEEYIFQYDKSVHHSVWDDYVRFFNTLKRSKTQRWNLWMYV